MERRTAGPQPRRRAWARSLGAQQPARPPQSLPSGVVLAAEGPGARPTWKAKASHSPEASAHLSSPLGPGPSHPCAPSHSRESAHPSAPTPCPGPLLDPGAPFPPSQPPSATSELPPPLPARRGALSLGSRAGCAQAGAGLEDLPPHGGRRGSSCLHTTGSKVGQRCAGWTSSAWHCPAVHCLPGVRVSLRTCASASQTTGELPPRRAGPTARPPQARPHPQLPELPVEKAPPTALASGSASQVRPCVRVCAPLRGLPTSLAAFEKGNPPEQQSPPPARPPGPCVNTHQHFLPVGGIAAPAA